MSRLLETINLTNGLLQNLEFHNRRFINSFNECFGYEPDIRLEEKIIIPSEFSYGTFRCRIIYDEKDFQVEFLPYQFRKIESLQMVVDDKIDYHLKFADRKRLEELFQRKGNCDDIIIIYKGLVTDSFAANLIFSDGENWFTPDKPLLNGTMRTKLLSQGMITEIRIKDSDIHKFLFAGLINAFFSFDFMPIVPINKIKTI